jgi:hypothetical protein
MGEWVMGEWVMGEWVMGDSDGNSDSDVTALERWEAA